MKPRILLVDDEGAVLAGYVRSLHREFETCTAEGAELGLKAIEENGPFAVVVSDMRMPGMNGAQFLSRVRETAPETIRMLLTGYTDMSAAMEAINEGNIFRFLTKPCSRELLATAIAAGVEQHRLVRSEKELLEKTLLGSIKVLADLLSASSPEAFGRTLRIVQCVRHIAIKFKFSFLWRLEAAATLSQLGCITLDPGLLQRAFAGGKLPPEEQMRFDEHPKAAMRLLSGVPRLEATAWVVGQQFVRAIPSQGEGIVAGEMEESLLGAKILKLAVAFDDLRAKGSSETDAIERLRYRAHEFEPKLLDALTGMKPEAFTMEARSLPITKCAVGMILHQEIRNKHDMLLFTKGQEVTQAMLMRLGSFSEANIIGREAVFLVPSTIESV